MRKRFTVTYDRTTPESVESCDYSESGFAYSSGGRCELGAGIVGEEAGRIEADNLLTLGEALQIFEARGKNQIEDNGDSFYGPWYTISYRTGEEERLVLHCPDNITAASLARVRRTLGLT